jgi:hypothetical protein
MATHWDLEIIEAADVTSLSRKDQAAALFKGTCRLSNVAAKEVCPVIKGQIAKADHEQAITGSFYRMSLFVRGLTRLDDPCHFQIANGKAGDSEGMNSVNSGDTQLSTGAAAVVPCGAKPPRFGEIPLALRLDETAALCETVRVFTGCRVSCGSQLARHP